MAFDLIAVRQSKSFVLDGQTDTIAVNLDASVASGSALLVIGAAVRSDTSQTVLLSSVSGGGTWASAINVRTGTDYVPNVFASIAPNVSAGSPSVTLTMNQTSSVRTSFVLFEVEKAVTSSVIDKQPTGTSASGTSTSTSSSGALTQTDNLVVLCAGGWFGIPQNPSGYTSYMTQQNGGFIGCQVSARKVTATTAITGTVAHDETAGAAALLLVLKAATTAAKRYKFLLDTATFTSADTGITAFVWRNADPDAVVAEKYTGLAGDGTAGILYIASGLPSDVDNADVIKGVFSSTNDTSGIVSGTVQDA